MTELFQAIRPSSAHEYTGERMSEGHGLETEVEHFHRYYVARSFAAGLDVLDIASGEGYGSALLAQVARSVLGVDIDPAAVTHAKRIYTGGNINFREGSATAMPVADASIDLLVSYETLEHFADHDSFFREAKRVLRPAGRLIISTPDRDIYSRPGTPPNPFHVLELNRVEFETLVGRYFAHHRLLGQRAFVGSALMATELPDRPNPPLVFDRRDEAEIAMSSGMEEARYYIAVCSDAVLDDLADSLFIHTGDIAGLTSEIPWLRHEIAERVAVLRQEQALHAAELKSGAEHLASVESDANMLAGEMQLDIVRAEAQVERLKEQLRLVLGMFPRHALQVLTVELARESTERARLAARYAEASATLDAIQGSLYWRVAQVMRRATQRRPRLMQLVVKALRALSLLRAGQLQQALRFRSALRRQRQSDMVVLSGHALFDHPWYRSHYLPGEPDTDPVAHYLWLGAAAGHNPHPLFDTTWYATRHPACGMVNPFVDYLSRGMAADEDPHPLFDAKFYSAQAPEAVGRALTHYAYYAPGDPRCPTPFFDVPGYLADNPSAAASGLDPVVHFATFGAAQNLDPHALFDTAWYRTTHLGGAPGTNPLAHWLREGAAAGLAPNPWFSSQTPADTAIRLPNTKAPAVSIIIPVYGRMLDTARCLYAIARHSGDVAYEVILADDRPAEPIAPAFAWIDGLRTHVNPVNMGFLRNCNAAARLARGRHIVFLNNDTVVHEGWLEPLLNLADSDPKIGMIGCKLLNRDGTVQEAGGALLDDGWGRPYGAGQDPALPEFNYVREVDVVIGASFLVQRAAFEAVGGFDDRYAPAYYEEFDLAFALRDRGLRVMYQPASEVTHLDGSTYGKAERDAQSMRNHEKFCRKWACQVGAQPSIWTPSFITRQRQAGGTILVMEDRVPEPDKNAGAVATAQYMALLVSLGLRVIYHPHDGRASQPYTTALQQQGIHVLHHPVVLTEWLRENGRFVDYVWSTRPYVSGHLIDQIRRDTGAPILYLTHDLHYLRETRRYALNRDPMALDEATRVRGIELAIFAKVDCILTFSEDEADVIRKAAPDATVRVLPLFFYDSLPEKADAANFAGRRKLLFVGGFNHVPNVDAALWLVREIMPALWRTHPDAQVSIVGSDPPAEIWALAGPLVEIAGFVPDLAESYAQARVSVNPLRFGAGVKGKIVASLSAGLPVVTTTIGNEGIRLRDGVEGLVGDTPDVIAGHIAALLDDDARCAELANAGAIVIARRFSYAGARAAVIDALGLTVAC